MYKEVSLTNRFLKNQEDSSIKMYRKDKKKDIDKDVEAFVKRIQHGLATYGVHSISYLIFITPIENVKIKYTDEKIHIYNEYEELNVILKIKFNEIK